MGTVPTTVPTLTAAQFAQRLAANFPPGWSSQEAKSQPRNVLYSVLLMIGTQDEYLNGLMQYGDDATRVQTAQDGALDLAGLDYFGNGPYALPRHDGETDDAYRARLLAAMLPAGATRPAMYNALLGVTGFPPRLLELWRPYDTGVWDGVGGPGAAGVGTMYWDVDTVVTPFRWADPGLRYQALIECVLPLVQPFGNNPTPCLDFTIFWDSPGSSFMDTPPIPTLNGQQLVYSAINRTKCEGTICWTTFVPAPPVAPAVSWDQPGVDWDQPGVNWQ